MPSALSIQTQSAEAGRADPARTGKADGERDQSKNVYAMSVWRKIQSKLEGREDSSRKRSVQEQVELILSEAASPDNLAAMYEGWTAWI